MSPRDRWLWRGAAAIVLLHALAFLLFPADLWGLSHLAAWPRGIGLAWTALALAALALAPRLSRRGDAPVHLAPDPRSSPQLLPVQGERSRLLPVQGERPRLLPFPGRRGAVLVACVAAAVFWIFRERTHLFGDGALLIRDRGFSESVTRAAVLVRVGNGLVRAGARAGLDAASSLAALSALSGAVAVYVALRLAATLTPDRGGRFLVTALVATSGATGLFFGHVEYYAPLASAVLVYIAASCRSLEPRGRVWPSWIVAGILPALHLSTLALAPAQLYVSVVAWRRGARREMVAGALAGLALGALAAQLAGASAGALAGTTLAGLRRYIEPYFAHASAKHDFGLFEPAHALALFNDWTLVAPLALAALPALWLARRQPADDVQRFLGIASLGCLLFGSLFHRELGPYRDWDILAWCGFVFLAGVGARWVRPHPGSQRAAIGIVLATGGYHLVPWVAMQVSPRAAPAHVQTVLRSRSQWSPHARGYMHEELAIQLRERGHAAESLLEYEAAVRANPADARYRVGLGTCYVEQGELERAVAEFDSALARRPDYAPAHNNLAFVLAELGRDLDRARAHADAALAASPGQPDYLETKARVLLRQGDRAGARQALETALQRRPNFPSARELLRSIDAPSRAGPPSGP